MRALRRGRAVPLPAAHPANEIERYRIARARRAQNRDASERLAALT
ncbi:MAG: hypothetical protein U0610_10220 [bacterium]